MTCIRHGAKGAAMAALAAISIFVLSAAQGTPTCPLSSGTTDNAKSHKLYLYFPTADDSTFPSYTTGASPARAFNVSDLDSTIGTTAALRDRIYDVVVDDYCEFNVQVIETTTNPATLASPPARRVTVAVGSDNPTGAWGQAQEVDTGDAIDIDFARVWAGTYTTCEGGDGNGGCSMSGSLTGANSTLDRWAQAIGGTAAHEGGHTYGLAHSDDNPNSGNCGDLGPAPTPGEDSFSRHLMPSGCNLTGPNRASYRRHISNRTYGILATNVGLSIQTMHNWDMVNPNSAAAHSLQIDFLSTQASVNLAWSWTGASSPWINPSVTGPSGTTVFKGTTYNRYRITWSAGNPSWSGGSPGVLPGGAQFHVGATFTGVDFNQPDPIIITNVTLFDASSSALALHPRIPMYDTGALDTADGTFALQFFAAQNLPPLQLQNIVVYHLPRVASIESMTGSGRPRTFDGERIQPWASRKCERGAVREVTRCPIAKIDDRPYVSVARRLGEPEVYDCSHGVPRVDRPREAVKQDTPKIPDYEGPICAGASRDPFPSATVYVIATFVDPHAKHWDRKAKKYVVGPVTTRLYYQFAGVRDVRRLEERKPNEPVRTSGLNAIDSALEGYAP